MANPAGFLAHLIKLIITIICLKYFEGVLSTITVRACQIFLVHSIIGMFRFGNTGGLISRRNVREFYERTSNIVEVIPFSMISYEISKRCEIDEVLRQSLLLILMLLPIVHEIISRKERSKIRILINYAINLELIIITIVCLQRGVFGVLNLVISYIFNRYFVESFCDWFDVPYDDLIQYSLCFVQIFSLTTLKEL
ncbi:uncharacterized protein [Chelonus insularis]|uniref:uncharacterized protein n=1 Tax=Chelonus insularis TaxID=460826 RepID=UPI00158C92BF|nr:uncharacterized protein LOC118072031 [Chelonus insularis]XP_034947482.1 uncharacterized protein LOC118072031 [Chelonus insularis]